MNPRALANAENRSCYSQHHSPLQQEIEVRPVTTNVFVPDAWRAAQEPEAITEALSMGEHITTLATQAITLIDRACHNVESIIENTTLRCQPILDQLASEIDRLTPILTRLRAAANTTGVRR